MKKALTLVLTDDEVYELYGILIDRDEAGALSFLEGHVRSRLHEIMDGG